ncbi:MAG TPA: dihydroorotase, partial [Candidatus Sumerlaeia bacterium]|nr:dihydroorotase [Candidatus Sumerlaeia bacterium]
MNDILIKNGRVVDPSQQIDEVRDVLISDGVIKDMGKNLKKKGAEEFDAAGMVVAPGLIDMH